MIVFGVIGGLVLAFGALGVLIAATSPGPDQADTYTGAIIFIVVGAVIAVPCTFFAYRMTREMPMPVGTSGLPMAAADLQQGYLHWFAWCQQALPGADVVSLHAATMAALAGGAAAATAEAARHDNRIGSMGTMPVRPNAAKVKMLSRIGASTIGLLEPSERVLVSRCGVNRSPVVQLSEAAFGLIGRTIAASRSGAVFVTVTNRRVIALIAGQYGGLANRVALMEPRSSVSVKARRALFTRTLWLKGPGRGFVRIGLPRRWQPEAAMAAEMLTASIGQVGAVGIIR